MVPDRHQGQSLEDAFTKLARGNYRRIAADAGLSPTFVGRALNGRVGMRFKVAVRLADAAGVSLDHLRWFIEANS